MGAAGGAFAGSDTIAEPCEVKAIVCAIARAFGGGGISGSGVSTLAAAAGLAFAAGASAFEEGAGASAGIVVVSGASSGARFTR